MISVIMLTYNREHFVSRAIESILAQTFHDFEFIIINNGSKDRSGVIADEYAKKDCRIRVIHRERGNIGSGRNAGLDASRGEWVTFIDDDDFCEPDFLEFLYKLAMDNSANIAICGAKKWENDTHSLVGIADNPLVMSPETAIIELLLRKRYNNGFPTKLLSRNLFEQLRFPNEGLYDDIHLMYKVIAGADKIVSYGLPKYNVVRHENNNSSATTSYGMITAQYLNDYLDVYRNRANWLNEKFPNNTGYWNYFNWSFQISMINKIDCYNLSDCKVYFTEMQNELSKHYKEFLNSPYILDFERKWLLEYVENK